MKYKVYCNGELIAEFKHKHDRDSFLEDCEEKNKYDTCIYTTEEG